MFLYCWRICLVCLALELVGPCVVLGFSVGMDGIHLRDENIDFSHSWTQHSNSVHLWDVASPVTHPGPSRYSESKIKCLPVENFTFQSMGIQCSLHMASQEWRILQPSEQDLVLKLSSEDRELEGVHSTHGHPRSHDSLDVGLVLPAATRERPRESFFNASRGPSPLP